MKPSERRAHHAASEGVAPDSVFEPPCGGALEQESKHCWPVKICIKVRMMLNGTHLHGCSILLAP